MNDLIGRRFGKWIVLALGSCSSGKRNWICRCDCGIEKEVRGQRLVAGESTHCKGCTNRTHNATKNHKPTPEYVVWASMIARCENPANQAYERYGGRGIGVCERWRKSFQEFIKDMGEKPAGSTIDRIDNNKGYAPENCRWATYRQQNRNRRDNRKLIVYGLSLCLSEWEERTGIKRCTMRRRLKLGWPNELVVSKAPRSTI